MNHNPQGATGAPCAMSPPTPHPSRDWPRASSTAGPVARATRTPCATSPPTPPPGRDWPHASSTGATGMPCTVSPPTPPPNRDWPRASSTADPVARATRTPCATSPPTPPPGRDWPQDWPGQKGPRWSQTALVQVGSRLRHCENRHGQRALHQTCHCPCPRKCCLLGGVRATTRPPCAGAPRACGGGGTTHLRQRMHAHGRTDRVMWHCDRAAPCAALLVAWTLISIRCWGQPSNTPQPSHSTHPRSHHARHLPAHRCPPGRGPPPYTFVSAPTSTLFPQCSRASAYSSPGWPAPQRGLSCPPGARASLCAPRPASDFEPRPPHSEAEGSMERWSGECAMRPAARRGRLPPASLLATHRNRPSLCGRCVHALLVPVWPWRSAAILGRGGGCDPPLEWRPSGARPSTNSRPPPQPPHPVRPPPW
eukprot:11228364-Lingulodinium_polyedra.AAC.7